MTAGSAHESPLRQWGRTEVAPDDATRYELALHFVLWGDLYVRTPGDLWECGCQQGYVHAPSEQSCTACGRSKPGRVQSGGMTLPDDVLALLSEIAGEHDVAWWEREAASWANSGDLNEGALAAWGLDAARLLTKYAPASTPPGARTGELS